MPLLLVDEFLVILLHSKIAERGLPVFNPIRTFLSENEGNHCISYYRIYEA